MDWLQCEIYSCCLSWLAGSDGAVLADMDCGRGCGGGGRVYWRRVGGGAAHATSVWDGQCATSASRLRRGTQTRHWPARLARPCNDVDEWPTPGGHHRDCPSTSTFTRPSLAVLPSSTLRSVHPLRHIPQHFQLCETFYYYETSRMAEINDQSRG